MVVVEEEEKEEQEEEFCSEIRKEVTQKENRAK